MAWYAEEAQRCPGVSQIFDLALAVAAPETICAKCLVTGQDGEVFDFLVASLHDGISRTS